MFKDAIDKTGGFTRPIHTIMRTYGGKKIIPGAGTLFFVNRDGYAITCKHVTDLLQQSDAINKKYIQFKEERSKIPKDGKFQKHLKGLEMKYNYQPDTIIQIKNSFVDSIDAMSSFTWHTHLTHDLAILKFNGFNKVLYSGHAVFRKDSGSIQPGEFFCRLGFPFPEFNNFRYNEATDDIEWTQDGVGKSPRFPIEGMMTRFLAENNKIYGIEMSTPGLKGQSGGPLFDSSGLVCGMQFSTKHLHLGFDMEDKEIVVNNSIKKVSDYSFIHLGQCIHSETIKQFLKEKGVMYYEE
jgi:hypothetical protein